MPLVLKVGTATPSRGMELPDELLESPERQDQSSAPVVRHRRKRQHALKDVVDHVESLLPRLAAGETFQVIDLACQSLHRNGEQAD